MELYQHFRPEERPFVDNVLNLRDQVERQFMTRFTDFLDPREAHIFESIIGMMIGSTSRVYLVTTRWNGRCMH